MKIKFYWPQCDLINGGWVKECIDSYWVECSYEEAENYVFPYLIPKQIKTSIMLWKQAKGVGYRGSDRLCFLVSKDAQSILPMAWFYPFSGHWNGYSPFVDIKTIEITKLEELLSIGL